MEFLRIIIVIISVLLALAYLTLAERKLMGSIQRRFGPNNVGVYGIGQPIVDGVKLIIKESLSPNMANKGIFVISPILCLFISLLLWSVLPIGEVYVYIEMRNDMLWIIGISTIGVITILWSGWSSHSKYSIMGSLRSTAQMISYEVIIGMIILIIILMDGGVVNIGNQIEKQKRILNIWSLFLIFVIWLIAIVAETNRAPFDLPEAESELVSGFNTEYGAAPFALWFIAEYGNIIFMSVITVDIFLGGNIILLPIIIYYFISIRAAYPRLRYSDLISICWEKLLPLIISFLILVTSLLSV